MCHESVLNGWLAHCVRECANRINGGKACTTTTTTTTATATTVETLKCENDNTIRHTQATTSRQLMSLQWGATCLRHTYTHSHARTAHTQHTWNRKSQTKACCSVKLLLLLLLLHVLGIDESLPFSATWMWMWMYCCFSNKIHSFRPAGSLVLFSAYRKTRSTVCENCSTHTQTHVEWKPRKYALNEFEMCSICDGMYVCLCVGSHSTGFCVFPLCVWSVLGKQCAMRSTRSKFLWNLCICTGPHGFWLTFHTPYIPYLTLQLSETELFDDNNYCMTEFGVTESVLCCSATKHIFSWVCSERNIHTTGSVLHVTIPFDTCRVARVTWQTIQTAVRMFKRAKWVSHFECAR